MIRVQVAIDPRLIRSAIAAALRQQPGIEVLDETAEGHSGAESASVLHPDVIVLSEPFGEPLFRWVATYRAAAPFASIVALLLTDRVVDINGNAGADALVDAGDGIGELAVAIRRVARSSHV